jgi:hypothetical protein
MPWVTEGSSGTGVPPPVRAAFAVALSVPCHPYGEEPRS